MLLRLAAPADAEEICRLNRIALGYDFPLEETRRRLETLPARGADGGDCLLVAEREGRVAGYVHARRYEPLYSPPLADILGIAVEPAYQGQGIGGALLEAVEECARAGGLAGVRLVSGASRTGAHAFYRARGYGGEKPQVNFKKFFSPPP